MQLDKRQSALLAAAALVLIVAGVIIARANRPQGASGVYFYDLKAGTLYTESFNAVAPVAAPSGGEGVRAMVYACQSCDDKPSQFIAFLSKAGDELAARRRAGEMVDPEKVDAGSFVRGVNDTQWHPAASDVGRKLAADSLKRCGSDRPMPCNP